MLHMKSLALQMLFRFVECFEKRLHTNKFHVVFGLPLQNSNRISSVVVHLV